MSKKAFQVILGSLLLFQQAQAVDCYNDSCCDYNYGCGGKFWAEADYLYWKIEDDRKVLPFVIEGPFDEADPVLFLGSPDSAVVLGDKKFNNDWRSGAKLAVGYWFDECRTFGAELSFFYLPQESKRQTVASDGLLGSSFLAVPFFDVNTGLQSSYFLSLPGDFAGSASLRLRNRMFGAEANAVLNIANDCDSKMGVLAGLRWWHFSDNLNFNTSSPFIGPAPDIFETKDKFRVRNNFYGFQLGANYTLLNNCFFAEVEGKIALGAMVQKSVIHGTLRTNDFTIPGFPPGLTFTFPGGVFAQPSNIGSREKTKFAYIPEVNLNFGYQFTDSIRVQAGYTFFYVSEVARASRQVSSNINPTQSIAIEFDPTTELEGVAAPSGKVKSKGMWVQGLNVGLVYDF